MNKELGEPIARGRTSDIFAWEDGKILKLFHDWQGLGAIQYEQKMGQIVQASGLPVPAVHEILEVNGHNGLIYQRLEGVNMWETLGRKPWMVVRFALRTAELQAEMHNSLIKMDLESLRERLEWKIQAAKPLPAELKRSVLETLASLPENDRLCHGDFHPGNILVTPEGERVIDWIDATRGNPLADVARTTVICLGAAASSQIPNPLLKIVVRIFHAIYLQRYFRLRPGGRSEYMRWLPVVSAARLSEEIPELENWLIKEASKVS